MRGLSPRFNAALLAFLAVAFFCASAVASPPRSRGARPIALGRGYTAVSGDVYSLFYNPAGLYDVNQQQYTFDTGRYYSIDEPAGSDFSFAYARPWRWRDRAVPVGISAFGERPGPGAHVIDITAGGATDAPADVWTKGLIKFPVKMGGALTIRQQNGEEVSRRVGKSAISLGLAGGFMVPINRRNQVGLSIQNLMPSSADYAGPSIHLGVYRQHTDIIQLFADLQFASGGVWRFQPGVEWLFARGVIRPRVGWGYRDSGKIDHLATGIGFYVSPLQIDFAYLMPLKTLNDNAGQLRASLTYKFGTPQFSEIYFDRALEQANQLDQKVLGMTVKEAELKSSLAELEQKKRIAEEELRTMKGRVELLKNQDLLGERDAMIRDLRARIKVLEGMISEQRSENQQLRVKRATVRTHVVEPGDTLQSIARQYYGDPNQWKRIYNSNADKIERGLPKAGSRLVIP